MKPIKANFLFNIYPFSLKHVMGMKHLDHNLEEVVLIGRKSLKSIFKEKKNVVIVAFANMGFPKFCFGKCSTQRKEKIKVEENSLTNLLVRSDRNLK